MIDGFLEAAEEPLQRCRVMGIESPCGASAHLGGGALEPVRVTSGEDDLGPLGPRPSGRLKTDTRTAPDDDDGLTVQSGHYPRPDSRALTSRDQSSARISVRRCANPSKASRATTAGSLLRSAGANAAMSVSM